MKRGIFRKITIFLIGGVFLVCPLLYSYKVPVWMENPAGKRISPNGANIRSWAPAPYLNTISGFNIPYDVAVNSTGDVYVVDYNNHRLMVFDNVGHPLYTIGTSQGTGDGQFQYPTGVGVNSSDNVYVADKANHRVQVFDNAGHYLYKFGSYGSANDQFYSPYGVAVNSSGHVYVADSGNDRVQVFDRTGQYLYTVGSGQLDSPSRVALNSTGHVYVADSFNHRIQVFDNAGHYLYTIGQLYYPYGVAINSTGYVYVADTFNNRVKVLDNSGQYLYTIGGNGAGGNNDQFNNPIAVAVNNTGHVFVADRNNVRVQVFGQPAWVADWSIDVGNVVYWNMTLSTCLTGNLVPNATGLFNTTMLDAGHGDLGDPVLSPYNIFALCNASLGYFNASIGGWTAFQVNDVFGAVNFTTPVAGAGNANFLLLVSPLIGGSLDTNSVNISACNYFALHGFTANPTYVSPTSVNLTLPGGSYWNVTYDQYGVATAYFAYFSPAILGVDQFVLRHAVRASLAVPPGPPTLSAITPSPSIDGRIALSWTSVSGATSYQVYRDTSTITSIVGLTPLATGLTTTTYTDSIEINGTYFYVVVAVNGTGVSPISNCEGVEVGISPTSTENIESAPVILILVAVTFAVTIIYYRHRQKWAY